MKRQDAISAKEPPGYLDDWAREVIRAATDVHRCLGSGFPESIYEGALRIELEMLGFHVERQVEVPIEYRGHRVGGARVDLLVERELVVELKSADAIHPAHIAQVLTYLRATRLQLGLVINFNASLLLRGVRRVILSPDPNAL